MTPGRRAALTLAGGVLAAYSVCIAFDLPLRDAAELTAYAGASAGLVAAGGLLVLRRIRRRSVGTHVTVAVLTAVAAAAAGIVVAANRMFISDHDLHALLIVVVAAGSVGVAVAVSVGATVATGSRSLGELARAIGSGGGHPEPPANAPREFAVLAGELAAMAARLAESTERERALETSRRDLVAWVSHDLRTPLAGIRAMAEALEDGVVSDQDTVARYHSRVRIEADRLTAMVDDLFELSRIHAGTLRLQLERVALGDLVSDALAAADPLASAKGVRLRGAVTGAPAVSVSVGEVSRVLRNLLHNAIRHTPSDGTVDVESGAEAAYAYVAVHDSCGGIPVQDLDRVFDVAFRGETARTPAGDGGAGLGLAIARGIVEAHSGQITVENAGDGCRFVVRLPLPAPA